jgi:hypothetical protein
MSPRARRWFWGLLALCTLGPLVATGVAIYASSGFDPKGWYSGLCVGDHNGDEVLDVAGVYGEAGADVRIGVVDGKTGETLWNRPGYELGYHVFCPTEGWFGVGHPSKMQVGFWPFRDPAAHFKRVLSDRPHAYGTAEGCVTIETRDDRTVGFAWGSGEPTECEASYRQELHEVASPHLAEGPHPEPLSLRHGDTDYLLSTAQKGTPFLVAAAHRNGETLWEQRLPLVAVAERQLAMVEARGALLIFGSQPDKPIGSLGLITLDATTGRPRYERELAQDTSVGRLEALDRNGPYVVFAHGYGLFALDPDRGEIAWQVGPPEYRDVSARRRTPSWHQRH